MTPQQNIVIRECVDLTHQGRITFPEVVARLVGVGVERYHADYTRGEKTYYTADGQSLVVPLPESFPPIADTFNAADVEAAIRQSQRGEITYPQFVQKTSVAGCVGYFAQLAGRRVIYFGRYGDQYVEPFPQRK